MTNKEAIRRILDHKRVHSLNEPRAVLINEALNLAIKALEERPQGEWRSCKQGDIPITDRCTNCNYEMKWYKNKHKYCPNCGADMRGKEK